MWKFVDGGEGEARHTYTDISVHLVDLAKGTWTYVSPGQISRSAQGYWSVNPRADHPGTGEGGYVAVLHDWDDGWRLMIPRGFEPGSEVGARSWLAVSHVYDPIKLSRKVRTIYEATGRGGLG